MKYQSLATKRAIERGYFTHGPEWYCEFEVTDIKGLGPERGVHRRDPSSPILIDGTYYTWYTKSSGPSVGFHSGSLLDKVFPWDQADIWYASSKDGIEWREEGLAIPRGEQGSYDDRSVFTPEVLISRGKLYLVYQVVKHPYKIRSFESIAIAVSDSPKGPWKKSESPIIEPSADGQWRGTEDNRFLVIKRGSFDSHSYNFV